jgi:hypothetical protein
LISAGFLQEIPSGLISAGFLQEIPSGLISAGFLQDYRKKVPKKTVPARVSFAGRYCFLFFLSSSPAHIPHDRMSGYA